MDEQIAAFASLFRVCARALRKLSLAGHAGGDTPILFEVATQLEILAGKLEDHVEANGRNR